MQFTVKDNTLLMDFLMKALAGKSRTGIKAMLAKRLVSVDHEVATQFNQPLLPGQTVMIGKKSPAEAVVLQGVKLIYDDDDLVVIEKSAGLLSVPTDTGTEKSALGIATAHLKRLNHKARLFIVHRLDRDTSGLMMFVKNKELQRQLRQNWQESVLTRRYAVVVEGVVAKDKGTIISWLKGTDSLRSYSSQTAGEGQKAVSHYKVLQRAENFSLLDVELETGRKNQIRVHMEDLGHPVVGDDKYGGAHRMPSVAARPPDASMRTGGAHRMPSVAARPPDASMRTGAAKNPLGRLGLHARTLTFTHPKTQKQMSFEAEVPPEFLRLFRPTRQQVQRNTDSKTNV